MLPMCSPSLLEGPSAIRTPSDLVHATLIHDESLVHIAPEAPSWRSWLQQAGVAGVDSERGPAFQPCRPRHRCRCGGCRRRAGSESSRPTRSGQRPPCGSVRNGDQLEASILFCLSAGPRKPGQHQDLPGMAGRRSRCRSCLNSLHATTFTSTSLSSPHPSRLPRNAIIPNRAVALVAGADVVAASSFPVAGRTPGCVDLPGPVGKSAALNRSRFSHKSARYVHKSTRPWAHVICSEVVMGMYRTRQKNRCDAEKARQKFLTHACLHSQNSIAVPIRQLLSGCLFVEFQCSPIAWRSEPR